MAQTYTITGNVAFSLSPDAQNAVLPLNLQFAYTMVSADQLIWTSPVTNQALDLGTITNPKALYIECLSGSAVIKLAAADVGSVTLSLSATPGATDRAVLQIVNPAGLGAMAPVVTVAADAKLKVIAVQ